MNFPVVKILSGKHGAGQKNRGINRRNLAIHCSFAGVHIDKMVKKTVLVLHFVPEKLQCGAGQCLSRITAYPATLCTNRVSGQCKADSGNTG
ncbi:MAG: hypothetical protein ACD_39C00055G0002, partial [uncultured bacterium]